MLTNEQMETLKNVAAYMRMHQSDEAAEALEAAIETLEKLPVTADKNHVGPLDFVYNENGRRYVVADLQIAERDANFGENESHIDNSPPRVMDADLLHIGLCYSARAEAARQQERD